jgi:hypothetical protein
MPKSNLLPKSQRFHLPPPMMMVLYMSTALCKVHVVICHGFLLLNFQHAALQRSPVSTVTCVQVEDKMLWNQYTLRVHTQKKKIEPNNISIKLPTTLLKKSSKNNQSCLEQSHSPQEIC